MAESLVEIVRQHGPLLFFGVGFAEFIGIPLASVAVLVVGGSLARSAAYSDPTALIASAAAGGLVADSLLFALTRWKGSVMVDAACGLTSNPRSCVLQVMQRVESIGTIFVVTAKFVPGVANLISPAAALAGKGAVYFVIRDTIALLLWAAAYTFLGWLFAEDIRIVLRWVEGYTNIVAILVLLAIGLATIWRLWRVHTHTRHHSADRKGRKERGIESARTGLPT